MTDLELLGLPNDEASTFARGAAQGPQAIREALVSDSANLASELGAEVVEGELYRDLGDLELPVHSGPHEETRSRIESEVSERLSQGKRLVCLGGDHAVTLPILRAHAARYEGLTVLQIDAHCDLYDELGGREFPTDRFSHGSPFARAMDEGLLKRLVQVGIRTLNAAQRPQVERHGVLVCAMKDFSVDRLVDEVVPGLEGPLYLTVDLDGLDPAFAPGVSHHEPGGFSTRDVLRLIHALPVPLVGADIVELNPERDLQATTAYVAAKLLREILAQMSMGSFEAR